MIYIGILIVIIAIAGGAYYFNTRSPALLTYTLTIEPPAGNGTTNPHTGAETYNQSDKVQISEVPRSGWSFDHWIVDGSWSGTADNITITMNSAHTVMAVFIKVKPVITKYNLTMLAPVGSGTTSLGVGSHSYDGGTLVNVTATPASSWVFDHWVIDGAPSGSTNPDRLSMIANHTLQAVFAQSQP